MAVSAAIPLREQPDVRRLFELFKTPGHEAEHQEYAVLLDYVEAVENRYNSILSELTTLREQISGIADKKNPIHSMVERLSSAVFGIGEKLKALKDSIVEHAQNTLQAVRDKSLSAIGAVSGFLHIKDGLQAVSSGLEKAAATMGTLEQFHQEIVTASKEESDITLSAAEKPVGLLDLLLNTRLDFENMTQDELMASYSKLLSIGMNNDLTTHENEYLSALVEDVGDLLPDHVDYEPEQTAENEAEQDAEL